MRATNPTFNLALHRVYPGNRQQDDPRSRRAMSGARSAARRDEIVRRMIATPPKPFTPKPKKKAPKRKKPSGSR